MKITIVQLEWQAQVLTSNIKSIEEDLEAEDSYEIPERSRIRMERDVNRMYYDLEILESKIKETKNA